MRKILSVAGILWLLAPYVVWAEEVQVVGALDKNQAQIDDEISLTVRIVGARGNVQAPRLPAYQGFDSFYTGRTSQITFVNGRSSSTVEFNYVLVPKVAGRFKLQPVEVWIEGKSFRTQPLDVEVMGSSASTGQPSRTGISAQPIPSSGGSSGPVPQNPLVSQPVGPPPQAVKDDNVFVKAAVDKLTAYPNEQILLTYALYTRYDTRYEGFEEEPSMTGFWVEDFPLDRDLSRDTVTVNGKRYVKADIRRIALFPTAPAQYTIQPGTLKVSVREEPRNTNVFDEFFGDSFFSGAGFFGRRSDRLLKPEPIAVTVRPFPETGKPASFNGVAGQFELGATVDKQEVKQNEPVSLKLLITGEGNLETLPKPKIPELTGFKIYDGDSSTQLFKTAGPVIAGKKTFEVIFIPTESGEMSIPPLEFSYFDPRHETYKVLRTQSFPLRVIPSTEPLRLPAELAQKEAYQKDVKREGQDIRFIHEEFPSERSERLRNHLYNSLIGLNLLGILAVGAALLRRREEVRLAGDVRLKRLKLAHSLASGRLKLLRRLAESRNPSEAERFIEEAEKVLLEYFSNKFNISAYNFTREWLEEKLGEIWGAEDPLLKQVREFYDLAGETRFGLGSLLAEERREFFQVIDSVIRRVEKRP